MPSFDDTMGFVKPSVFLLVAFGISAFFLFFLFGVLSLDPDFGWHLKMGELIIKHGIPKTDPFSYSMSSFPFVDHEWMLNVLMYQLYTFGGYFWLAALFAAVACGSILIALRFQISKWSFVPLLLACATLLAFSGVRTQVLTWFFFSLLSVLLVHENLWRRFKIFVPLLFILWVNLHGGFASGIALLALAVVARIITRKKLLSQDSGVFVFSLLATLCNPYGIRIWEEVIRQLTDNNLRFSIQEWVPAIFVSNVTLWIFVPLSILLVSRYFKRFSFTTMSIYGFWLMNGILSVRHMPLWIFIALPMTICAVKYLSLEAEKIKEAPRRLAIAHTVFLCIVSLCVIFQLLIAFFGGNLFNESNFYPKRAVFYLKNHARIGNIFSVYSWGGYLIWKLPEKKVFIDGRMPSWRGYRLPKAESSYAFIEYGEILHSRIKFLDAVEKYHIDTLLLPIEKKEPKQLPLQKEFDKLLMKLGKKDQDESSFYRIVKESGWQQVYKDSVTVIYRRG